MAEKKILCIYATRQIDSNLFMSSTKFNGLKQCGYTVDMLFCGPDKICYQFNELYGHFFRRIVYINVKESAFSRALKAYDKGKILYTYYREFIMDFLYPPFELEKLGDKLEKEYDIVLSFVPIALGGILAYKVRNRLFPDAKLIQYWTDPISMGRCDSISEIPRIRFLHKRVERQLLGMADKVVFCWPLFCKSMQQYYPNYSSIMTWSDTAYISHEKANYKPNNKKITIGLFGAYQQRVRNILPYLDSLDSFPDVQFVIRGDSDFKIDSTRYENLDIKEGRVPVKEVEELEANCDILVCLAGKSGLTIPAGKVFYYADYNKPILYISDGVNSEYTSSYLNEFKRFVTCDNNKQSIIKGLECCISQLPGYQVKIPARLEPSFIARKLIEE